MNEAKKVTVNGEKYTFKELSNMTGINILTIKTRYKKGIRGSGLIKPLEKNKSECPQIRKVDYIHKVWGGKWVYSKPRKYYKNNLYWVFTAK